MIIAHDVEQKSDQFCFLFNFPPSSFCYFRNNSDDMRESEMNWQENEASARRSKLWETVRRQHNILHDCLSPCQISWWSVYCFEGLISQKKVYDAKCKAELYLEGKVLKSMRDIVGIHDGTVAVKEIDLGEK